MPFNGSGTFSRLYSWVVDAANSVNISSTHTDAEMNGFAAGLTNCVTRDGQSPPSADLPMGGKKLVNLGLATVGTDALSQNAGDARYMTLTATDARYLQLTGGTLSGPITGQAATFTGLQIGSGADVVDRLVAIQNQNAFFSVVAKIGAAVGIILNYSWASGGQGPLVIANALGEVARFPAAGGFSVTGALSATGAITQNGNQVWHAGNLTPSTYAPLASPTLSGTPAAPTAAVGTNTTQLATTAFVQAARSPIGQTITSSATVTPTFNDDFVEITAQAGGLTLANPTGSAVNMWGIAVRIKDNATPQTIAFGTQYRGVGVTLPTTTVSGKTLVLGMIFNSTATKWDVVSVAQE